LSIEGVAWLFNHEWFSSFLTDSLYDDLIKETVFFHLRRSSMKKQLLILLTACLVACETQDQQEEDFVDNSPWDPRTSSNCGSCDKF
jgi:hypothetical protein